jgi:AraC-like DNA-binding protein
MAKIALGMSDMSLETGENAYFEHISIPDDHSFIWRIDDYPWRRNVWNYHPEIEIHLIRASSGICYIGDYIGNFEPGQLIMIGSNLPHNWISLPADGKLIEKRDIVVQFDPTSFVRAINLIPELQELRSLFNRATLGLEFMGEDAKTCAHILEKIGRHRGLRRIALMSELLASMADASNVRTLATQRFASGIRTEGTKDLQRIERALNYMQEHYLSSPRIGMVASFVGMSEAAFSRFFKIQTGNTFTDHLTILKIWSAKNLLRDSDLSVTEICYEAGFRNVSNFNRMFLRHAKLKPSDYRKAARQIAPDRIGYELRP